MNRAMYSLFEELMREAHAHRVPISVLARFSRKTKKAKHGEVDFSKIIIPLIREIEKEIRNNKNMRERDKESTLLSLVRKRDRFSELQKEVIYRRRK